MSRRPTIQEMRELAVELHEQQPDAEPALLAADLVAFDRALPVVEGEGFAGPARAHRPGDEQRETEMLAREIKGYRRALAKGRGDRFLRRPAGQRKTDLSEGIPHA